MINQNSTLVRFVMNADKLKKVPHQSYSLDGLKMVSVCVWSIEMVLGKLYTTVKEELLL